MKQPRLPLPAPLRASDGHPFVEDTVRYRLTEQIERIIADNMFAPSIVANLRQLIEEIPDGALRPPQDGREDAWLELGAEIWGTNWLDAPWLFVEIYFYRLLMEAIRYFELGHDPFAVQKQESYRLSAEKQHTLINQLNHDLTNNAADSLPTYLSAALWGNQFDLGLFPSGSVQPETAEEARAAATLIDDSAEVVEYLLQQPCKQIDIVLDNAGMEFVSDLCLADFLLTRQVIGQVVLHCKDYPFFVSDVTLEDAEQTFRLLKDQPETNAFGERLAKHFAEGRILLVAHPHWTTGLAHWQMPNSLRAELAQSDLIISKGDANYRRWLGDLQWKYTTPFADIVAYAPAPLLCVRTYKAPLASGLSAELVTHLNQTDPGWDVSGRYGQIQFDLVNSNQ